MYQKLSPMEVLAAKTPYSIKVLEVPIPDRLMHLVPLVCKLEDERPQIAEKQDYK